MANDITVSEARLKELLDEVEIELGKALKTEEGKLAKAASPDEDPAASVGAPPPASPDASASASPGASASAPPPPAAEGSAESPEASNAAPGEAPGEMPPGGSPGEGAEAAPSEDDLKQAYGQLDDEALKMHYMAIKAALFERMGAGDGAAPDASASPAGPPAGAAPGAGAPPPAPAPMAPGPEMGKAEAQPDNSGGILAEAAPTRATAGKDRLAAIAPGKAGAGKDRLAPIAPTSVSKEQMPWQKKAEMAASPGNGGDALAPARKSEDELADLKKNQTEMEAALGSLVGAVRTMLETPVRKAVTSAAEMAFVPRTAAPEKTLSKSEILTKLNEKAKTPGLKKSDRELINKFCVGAVDAKDIAHLLTE